MKRFVHAGIKQQKCVIGGNRVMNIKKMNNKNRLNYIKGKIRRYLNNKDINKDYSEINDLIHYSDFRYCHKCPAEDFGYCGFRNDDRSDREILEKFCFPQFLENVVQIER